MKANKYKIKNNPNIENIKRPKTSEQKATTWAHKTPGGQGEVQFPKASLKKPNLDMKKPITEKTNNKVSTIIKFFVANILFIGFIKNSLFPKCRIAN